MINMFEEKINGKCPVETTIKLLGGKYKSTIPWALRDGTLRYGELQKRVSQTSPKMLAEQLNEMIEDKLIRKTVYPVVPPKTEYSLTAFGKAAPVETSQNESRIWPISVASGSGITAGVLP